MTSWASVMVHRKFCAPMMGIGRKRFSNERRPPHHTQLGTHQQRAVQHRPELLLQTPQEEDVEMEMEVEDEEE